METMRRATKGRDDGKLSNATGRQLVAPAPTSGRFVVRNRWDLKRNRKQYEYDKT